MTKAKSVKNIYFHGQTKLFAAIESLAKRWCPEPRYFQNNTGIQAFIQASQFCADHLIYLKKIYSGLE